MLDINSVLSLSPDAQNQLFQGYVRFLCVKDDMACLIRLDVLHVEKSDSLILKIKAPFVVSKQEIMREIEAGNILTGQIFETGLPASLEQLSEAALREKNKRNILIQQLIEREEILFDAALRGLEIARCAKDFKVNPRTIRRLFYIFLWGGQTDLALAPLFKKRGAPGASQIEGARRGRKGISTVPIYKVREKLRKGAKKYYMPGKEILFEAFVHTKDDYFSSGAKYAINEHGKTEFKAILLPPEELPSEKQFRSICEEIERNEGKRSRKPRKVRSEEQPWEFRGKARDGVDGPGFRFEIDPSKYQIQLVAPWDRSQIVGSATFYIDIDVWSGAYVGYSISLGSASWALASESLHTCFTPKQRIFERLGLDYTNDDWPCQELCSRLAADRGELVSNKAGVIPETGMKVEIMPSMCPERKGKVESAICSLKHNGYYDIPGRYPKFRQRRETDGKKTACLTLHELELLIVEIILDLNNEPVPISHVPFEMIEAGETEITHIGLYKWGLKNRCGFTRTLSPKQVYAGLLLKAKASVTPLGLEFKGLTFLSQHLHDAGYTSRARNNGNYQIEIGYNERYPEQIWYVDECVNDLRVALCDDAELMFNKMSFTELNHFTIYKQQLYERSKTINIHRRDIKNIDKVKPMIKNAKAQKKFDKSMHASSKNHRTGIRDNKKANIIEENLRLGEQVINSYAPEINQISPHEEENAQTADLTGKIISPVDETVRTLLKEKTCELQ